jgi:hypothetical protein
LREHEAEFRTRGARLAAIGLGDVVYARAFREDSGIRFPLLIDAEHLAYRAGASWLCCGRAPRGTASAGKGRTRSSSAAASSSGRGTSIATRT